MNNHRVIYLLSFLTAISVFVVAQDSFTLLDAARMRHVVAAKISPDGNSIAYLTTAPRRPGVDKDGPSWTELYVVDRQGNSRPFITGQVDIAGLSWTPDGRNISFLTRRGEDKRRALYTIAIDGGEARKVVDHEMGVGSYSWSPDGGKVAFLAREKEAKEDEDLAGKGFHQDVYEENWQSVKVWIAKAKHYQHWQEEEDSKPQVLDLPGSASAVEWSPDGQNLAVALAPTSLIDDHYMYRKIHVVSVQSGKSIQQFKTEGKLGDFAWSPNGLHLALIGSVDIHDPRDGRLFVGTVGKEEVTNALPDYLGHIHSIAWQNDDFIMYAGDQGVYTSFGKIARDGGNHKVILEADRYSFSSISLARNGQEGVWIADSPKHGNEVYFMKHGDKEPTRLTNSNPWLDKISLAHQEVVEYKARDGLNIQGILIHPLNRQPDKRYPLVLIVHGGPEAHFRNSWLTTYGRPGQVLAAQGFAAFYPNYRGSTGRGVEFSKADQADYAGKEFDDLVDGVDHLIALGLVDKSRVGVTGGSYGGYASAWCATYYSERFAASVMFVGISDQISKFGTTDIPNEMYLVHARKWPWEDWQFFRERSPITHFQKCRTPILIMHGREDTRVHPSQSMELYRYLKTYDKVPVRLVFYPGEGHGNRKAAGRLDYSIRLMRWMNHYLKGDDKTKPPYKLDYSEYFPKKEEDKQESQKSEKEQKKGETGD